MSYMQGGYNTMDAAGFYGDGGSNNNNNNMGKGGMKTETSPKKSKSAASESGIQPVNCKQIAAGTVKEGEDGLHIEGREVTLVTLVGVATKVDITTTMCTFHLEDGTGTIQVRMFVNDGSGGGGSGKQIPDGFAEGRYCRVFARVSTFQSVRGLTAFRILIVADFNEITYHMMEVKYVQVSSKLLASGNPFGHLGMAPATNGGGGGGNTMMAGKTNPYQQQQQQHGGNSNFAFVSGGQDSKCNMLQRQIIEMIKKNAMRGEETTLTGIKAALPSVKAPDIEKAVEFLFQEAYIYTSNDESYLPTDMS